jgi:hypothetical protein
MKSKLLSKKWWLLLLIPVFSNGICNRSNDDVIAPPSGDQYVTWSIAGANGNLSSPPDSIGMVRQGNTTVIFGMNANNSTNFYAAFARAQAAGTYPSSDILIYTNGRYYVQTGTPVQVNVTNYGAQGQYITGTYSGNVKDSTAGTTVAISGQFKVKNK